MQFNRHELPNGLRVITIPMIDNPTVTVLVLAEAGSKYETKEVSGISHFLEHMCFKGTEKRPKAIDISRELDSIGSQYNAFTSHEYTGYYARAQARQLPEILDVISDIYLGSTLPIAEIEKEKGVVIEEINMYEDMPHKNVHDLYLELLYGDQPAGWNIAGTRESVTALTREKMSAYRSEHYVGAGTVIVVSGAIDETKVLADITQKFSNISTGAKQGKSVVKEFQSAPQIKVKYRATDQTHVVLGFRTFDTYDPRNPALEVLANILGGGMSSRLFQTLREERGLGYYVSAHRDSYTDHGNLTISAGVAVSKIEEALKVIMDECKLLKEKGVTAEELAHVKEYITGNMFLELESSEDLAHFYGIQEILKKPILNANDIEKKIRAVTVEDIAAVAAQIFDSAKLNLAIVGPYKDGSAFEKLLII